MDEEKKKIRTSTRSQFKRVIDFSYPQVASECVNVITTQTTSEKVPSTVATFSDEFIFGNQFGRGISYGYKQIVSEFVKVSTTQTASEKVPSTVATFLKVDG